MKKLFYFLMILPLFSLTGCEDDDNTPTNPIDQLPPATQTGANTFGCLINGEPLSITNSNLMTAIYQGGFVQFGGGGVYMRVLDPFTVNTFNDLTNRARYIIHQDNAPALCYYDFEDCFEGYVKFTKIDQTNYIISGTFEFSTVNEQCDTVRITNGRFDMRYIP